MPVSNIVCRAQMAGEFHTAAHKTNLARCSALPSKREARYGNNNNKGPKHPVATKVYTQDEGKTIALPLYPG